MRHLKPFILLLILSFGVTATLLASLPLGTSQSHISLAAEADAPHHNVLTTTTPSPTVPLTATATISVTPSRTPSPLLSIFLPNIAASQGSGSTIPTRTPSPTPAPGGNNCLPDPAIGPSDTAVDAALANRINQQRSNTNLVAYVENDQLQQAARRHTEDMAVNGALSHTGSDGTIGPDRIEQACYTAARAGEIIGWGFPTVDAMMNWWMNSDVHRPNILHNFYTEMGIGYRNDPSSQFTHYWVVTFATPAEEGRDESEFFPYRCVYTRIGDGYGGIAVIEQAEPCQKG